jgi:hypothetical protein
VSLSGWRAPREIHCVLSLDGQASVNVSQVLPQVLPWDLNPALLQDRLETVARIAVSTRNRAFAEADRAAGDTNWGLACKAHERLMHALSDVVQRGAHPWLGLVREGLYLMPLIEGVPVRLYRGAADRPSSRHLDAVRLEHERWVATRSQMSFDFMAGASADGPWYWLMAMETDAAGIVTRVVFVQANDAGETRHPWECPLPAPEANVPGVVRLADKRARRGAKPGTETRQEGFWGAVGAE